MREGGISKRILILALGTPCSTSLALHSRRPSGGDVKFSIMPELPEVENFRTLLQPLVSEEFPIKLERGSLDKKPPRKFISDDEISKINTSNYFLSKVLRKGKLIAMVLVTRNDTQESNLYLMVHMGMTGRISTPDHVPELESLTSSDYPPPHTYLKFYTTKEEACFSDPRKFGSIQVESSLDAGFRSLAPDAWTDLSESTMPDLVTKLVQKSMGIKALLLDQKRVVSGVGNWVADEVLYQTAMHPDQNYLTSSQATHLLTKLHSILSTAISCLVEKHENFPIEWLFHYRWNSKKATKDFRGRSVTFVTSGGRTSAIVASLQRKRSQLPDKSMSKNVNVSSKNHLIAKRKREIEEAPVERQSGPKVKLERETLVETKSKEGSSTRFQKVKNEHGDNSRRSLRLAKVTDS